MPTYDDERRNVGEGWWPLLDRLHAELTAVVGEHEVSQIKQKDGGLRYYFPLPEDTPADVSDEVRRLKDEAEEASYSICERCGAEASQVWVNQWTWTLCPRHHDELERRYSGEAADVSAEPPRSVGVVVAVVLVAAVTLMAVLVLLGEGAESLTLPAVVGTALVLVCWAAVAARRSGR